MRHETRRSGRVVNKWKRGGSSGLITNNNKTAFIWKWLHFTRSSSLSLFRRRLALLENQTQWKILTFAFIIYIPQKKNPNVKKSRKRSDLCAWLLQCCLSSDSLYRSCNGNKRVLLFKIRQRKKRPEVFLLLTIITRKRQRQKTDTFHVFFESWRWKHGEKKRNGGSSCAEDSPAAT